MYTHMRAIYTHIIIQIHSYVCTVCVGGKRVLYLHPCGTSVHMCTQYAQASHECNLSCSVSVSYWVQHQLRYIFMLMCVQAHLTAGRAHCSAIVDGILFFISIFLGGNLPRNWTRRIQLTGVREHTRNSSFIFFFYNRPLVWGSSVRAVMIC